MTTIITGERGDSSITRQGLEEYVSDCVIVLDHRVHDQISTRRLRIVKYRGSLHGTNEYPFLIDESGISVLPITSLHLNHTVSGERISSGIARLDSMLGGKGFYKGSTILITGTAGTGKTSIAAHFASAAAESGKRVLYFAFEESPQQIIRNAHSIGINLDSPRGKEYIKFHASRPSLHGLEMHLVTMNKLIRDYQPDVVIIDPITNLEVTGTATDVRSILTRLIDFLKYKQITVMLTSLTKGGNVLEQTKIEISSIADTWILLRDIEQNGERNRGIYILKSRGMEHSNQIREFLITAKGIDLVDVYLGQEGIFTGSARITQEAKEKAGTLLRRQNIEKKKRDLARKKKLLDAKIEALKSDFETEQDEMEKIIKEQEMEEDVLLEWKKNIAHSRILDKKSNTEK